MIPVSDIFPNATMVIYGILFVGIPPIMSWCGLCTPEMGLTNPVYTSIQLNGLSKWSIQGEPDVCIFEYLVNKDIYPV